MDDNLFTPVSALFDEDKVKEDILKKVNPGVPPTQTQSQPIGAQEFFKRFKEKFKDSEFANRISIEKLDYKNNYTKGIFICSKHGEFKTTPANMMTRGGCPHCVNITKRITTEEFIKRAKKIHGDLYDYSKTEYIGMNDPVLITCRVHGDFHVRTANHVHPCYDGKSDKPHYSGCQKCSNSLRFKVPDPEVLKRQLEMEAKYIIKRVKLDMSSKDYVDELFDASITTCLFMVQKDDLPSDVATKISFATQYTSKLVNMAIDIITEPLAIDEEFLNYLISQAMDRIVFLGDKFQYQGVVDKTNTSIKLDRLKESLWKVVDAAQERLDNGNKQICITRKEASMIL
jgi:hypothetical protein